MNSKIWSFLDHNTSNKLGSKIVLNISIYLWELFERNSYIFNIGCDLLRLSICQKIFSNCLLPDHCAVLHRYNVLCYNVCTKYLLVWWTYYKEKTSPKEQFGLQKTIVVGGMCYNYPPWLPFHSPRAERCTNFPNLSKYLLLCHLTIVFVRSALK